MAAKKKDTTAPGLTLEGLLTGAQGFGLTTATNVQRAKCRILQGLPLGDLADDPRVVRAVGGPEALPYLQAPPGPPALVVDASGIRGGKSLTIAALATHATQTVDISHLGPGEVPRYSILSTSIDIAEVSFNDHVIGKIMASPRLRALVLEEPKAHSILLRHPSGRPAEIKIVAGSRAGSTLVARWSLGMAADEATRMHGDEAVVNFEDSYNAIEGRLLDGAVVYAPGSPWAPMGPIYDRVTTRWGKPGPDLVVIRAPAYDLNPERWTPERIARLRPDVRRTDIEAEFADADTAMYASVEVERAQRKGIEELPRSSGRSYFAATDPATRGNAWTLVVAHMEGERLVIDCARQWQGSKAAPLDPRTVIAEMAQLLRGYALEEADTDQLGYDFAAALADNEKLSLVLVPWTASNKVQAFEALRRRLATNAIEIPPDPLVRADLIAVRKRLTTTGVAIHLPETGDGRHCDFAPPLARLAHRGMTDTGDDQVAEAKEEETWEAQEIEARERGLRERSEGWEA